ncbi:MAG: RNA polymerase sigma factor [Phycisphaerae bacterium]
MTTEQHDAGGPDPAAIAGLLSRAMRGDERAWRELVGAYGPRVFALAQSRCHNADVAEEIMQSVFATVAVKVRGRDYIEHGKFEAWLFRVAMNRVRDYARSKKRSSALFQQSTEPVAEAAAQREQERTDGEQLSALRAAMEQLPDADREVIDLRHHGDLSFKQIADLLDEPLGTLLARHHRALRKLKELVENAMQGGSQTLSDTGGQQVMGHGKRMQGGDV